jgi:hypothetical protein
MQIASHFAMTENVRLIGHIGFSSLRMSRKEKVKDRKKCRLVPRNGANYAS